MKKFILALIAAVICFSTVCYAGNKITFRDIPWGTSVCDASKYFLEWDWSHTGIQNSVGESTNVGYKANGEVFDYTLPNRISADFDYIYCMKWTSSFTDGKYGELPEETRVAGWEISRASMYFIDTTGSNMNNAKLYCGFYMFDYWRLLFEYETAVEDLTSKLTDVYGNSKTSITVEEGPMGNPTYTFWEDSEGNYVYLYNTLIPDTKYSDYREDGLYPQITLTYVSGDFVEDLETLVNNVTNSVDGL